MVIAETLEIFNGICNHCRNVKGIVVCHTCQALLCPECDSTFHFNHIAHDRVILQGVIQKLKSVQHVDLLGKVQDRGRGEWGYLDRFLFLSCRPFPNHPICKINVLLYSSYFCLSPVFFILCLSR
jgi:hypothetical protein